MLVTLDFETFYDADYTLKKLSTSEYIRHPLFEAINCSIMLDDGSPRVYWGHEAIQEVLDEVDWDDAELLAHHCQFEGLILSHHFGVRPATYRDTLSMARGVFPKSQRNNLEVVAERLGVANKLAMPDFKGLRLKDFDAPMREAVSAYVQGDVVSCYQAYRKMLPMLPASELELIDITVRMFADPVLRLDVPAAQAEQARALAERSAQIDAALPAGTLEEKEKVLGSSAKVAAKLREYGVEPPMKISARTKKPALAMAQTDLEFTALQKYPDDRVQALVKGRLAAKSTIGASRVARLLHAAENGMCLPVYLNYCGAHTTRWSGGDKLNFQNLPRAEKGVAHSAALRRALLAPPGQVLVVVDSSQIEVRVLAWLAGEGWLLDAFADGADPYCIFGTKAYGRVVEKDTPERQLAKVCVLALGYGMGAWKLQQTFAWGTMGPAIDLPLEVCEGFVRAYRQTSRSIMALHRMLQAAIGDIAKGRDGAHKAIAWEKDKIHLPNGMTLHYPNTRAVVEQQRMGAMFGDRVEERIIDGSYDQARGRGKLYGGLLTENVVQALARVVVAEQMRMISKRYRVVMMSHDEVVYLAPEAEAQAAYDFGLACMRTRPAWAPDLPLNADGAFAANYSK
jgi:hypothetical protein